MGEWSTFFKNLMERNKERPKLKRRDKPCSDCAVIHGLYKEIAEALKKEPDEMRKFISERWFCHDKSNSSCEGNWQIHESD